MGKYFRVYLLTLVMFLSLLVHASVVSAQTFPNSCVQSGYWAANYECIEGMISQNGPYYWLNDMEPIGGSPTEVFTLETNRQNAEAAGSNYSWTFQMFDAPRLINVGMEGQIIQYGQLIRLYQGVYDRDYYKWSTAYVSCPAGWTVFPSEAPPGHTGFFDGLPGYCGKFILNKPNIKNPPKLNSCSAGMPVATDHPINTALGNKFLVEKDYITDGIKLIRNYSSQGMFSNAGVGVNWNFGFEGRIAKASSSWVTVIRPNGSYFTFKLVGNSWLPDADISDKLSVNAADGGWIYFDAQTNATEYYDAIGLLKSVVSLGGEVTTYTHLNGKLSSIKNQVGQEVVFSYDALRGGLNKIKLPDGGWITYQYDVSPTSPTFGNLTSVTYPDGKVKTYLYGEPSNVSASPDAGVSYTNSLTGIIDENGNRYANYFYDAAGRATSEYLAGNVDAASLVYNVDGSGNPT